MEEELICPITHDLLVDPIILPCCGKAISRQSLIDCKKYNNECPLCRHNIANFDPEIAPKCVNINYMLEKINQKNNTNNTNNTNNNNNIIGNLWQAQLDVLDVKHISKKYQKIGKLNIECKDNIYKNLLIAVVDVSGSMSGSPLNQCKYSLQRFVDFTYKYDHLITIIVTYSDTADNFTINKNVDYEINKQNVENIRIRGGTNFKSGFDEIIKVCSKYSNDNNVSSMNCIFLTDGQDTTSTTQTKLISDLKTNLEKSWSKDYVVHTVGFGQSHDSKLLDGLRKIGTKEGAYRFADYGENNDALSSKINSILDIVATNVSVSYDINQNNFPPIICRNNNTYWLDLTNCNIDNLVCELVIDTNNINTNMEIKTQNNNDVYNKWYSYLMDNMISELMLLNNAPESFEKKLHLEIINKRIILLEQVGPKKLKTLEEQVGVLNQNGLEAQVLGMSDEYQRLVDIKEILEKITNGDKINDLKLKDMKYEGIFKTTSVKKNNNNNNITNNNTIINKPVINNIRSRKYWITENRPSYKRCFTNDDDNNIFTIIGTSHPIYGCDKISQCNNLHVSDCNDSNALCVASSIGRYNFVRTLIENGVSNDANKFGYNSVDLAILFGHYKTLDVLLEYKLDPSVDITKLFMTCLSQKHYITAEKLITNGLINITTEMIECAPNIDIINWLTKMMNTEVDINTAIINSMVEQVEKNLHTIDKISWKSIVDVLIVSDQGHLKIIDLLLGNNKLIVDEEFEYNGETTWPLFVACEKGNIHMFKLLVKHMKNFSASINKQNNKGTTLLWISVCNGHIDIVMDLLNYGADPNIANLKGDSPLIPCCQKGYINLVDILLEYGADLNVYNNNRDNPILICCRTGQHIILEKLLDTMDKQLQIKILDTFAEIDGFVPLLAATELDKVECIKVCLKYGTDIEKKSEIDNEILSGGTALHLACYYGKINSAMCLCENGANIYATSGDGSTPLHLAIKQGHIVVTKYLLSCDKDKKCLDMADLNGFKPIYYAMMNNNEKLYNDLFLDKLSVMVEQIIYQEDKTLDSSCDVIIKYGYDVVGDLFVNNNTPILTHAIICGCHKLTDTLRKINANENATDNFGVGSVFWESLLGGNNSNNNNNNISEKVIGQLENVKKVAQQNVQNRLMLKLSNNYVSKNKYLINSNTFNINFKMHDSYNIMDVPNMESNLKESINEKHSLLGFIEKMNDVFGKEHTNYIVWEAKLHIIKIIASDNNKYNLDPIHIMALYLYTGNSKIFQNVNDLVKKWNNTSIWTPFVYCLYQALNKLPNYEGELYKTLDSNLSVEIGQELCFNTFGLATTNKGALNETISKKTGVIYIIQSKSAKEIGKYSKYYVDAEYMIVPFTKFRVANFYKPDIHCIGQANIRHTTYKVGEEDVNKARNGKGAIVVELIEL